MGSHAFGILALALAAVVLFAITRLWRIGVKTHSETKNGVQIAEFMVEATRAKQPRWKLAAYFTARRIA